MKALLIGLTLLLSHFAFAADADYLGSWNGTCTESTPPGRTSEMSISFTDTPKLTLNVWGISLINGQMQRYTGNNPADFLFTAKGNSLSLNVKFDQDRAPEMRWAIRKSGSTLAVTTTQYHGGQFIPGTRWVCVLNQ